MTDVWIIKHIDASENSEMVQAHTHGCETVADFKLIVEHSSGIQASQQVLFHAGKELLDHERMDDYHFHNQAPVMIELFLRQ
jgi:hypothetical protein